MFAKTALLAVASACLASAAPQWGGGWGGGWGGEHRGYGNDNNNNNNNDDNDHWGKGWGNGNWGGWGFGGWGYKENKWGQYSSTSVTNSPVTLTCAAYETGSTCSAQYTTKTEAYTKPTQSVYTITNYKPETVVKTVYSTEYEYQTETVTETKTSYLVETKSVPYTSESYTTICYTKPVQVTGYSTQLISKPQEYTETSLSIGKSASVQPVPTTVVESQGYPQTVTKWYQTTYYSTISEFVSSVCSTTSSCKGTASVSSTTSTSSSSSSPASPTTPTTSSYSHSTSPVSPTTPSTTSSKTSQTSSSATPSQTLPSCWTLCFQECNVQSQSEACGDDKVTWCIKEHCSAPEYNAYENWLQQCPKTSSSSSTIISTSSSTSSKLSSSPVTTSKTSSTSSKVTTTSSASATPSYPACWQECWNTCNVQTQAEACSNGQATWCIKENCSPAEYNTYENWLQQCPKASSSSVISSTSSSTSSKPSSSPVTTSKTSSSSSKVTTTSSASATPSYPACWTQCFQECNVQSQSEACGDDKVTWCIKEQCSAPEYNAYENWLQQCPKTSSSPTTSSTSSSTSSKPSSSPVTTSKTTSSSSLTTTSSASATPSFPACEQECYMRHNVSSQAEACANEQATECIKKKCCASDYSAYEAWLQQCPKTSSSSTSTKPTSSPITTSTTSSSSSSLTTTSSASATPSFPACESRCYAQWGVTSQAEACQNEQATGCIKKECCASDSNAYEAWLQQCPKTSSTTSSTSTSSKTTTSSTTSSTSTSSSAAPTQSGYPQCWTECFASNHVSSVAEACGSVALTKCIEQSCSSADCDSYTAWKKTGCPAKVASS